MEMQSLFAVGPASLRLCVETQNSKFTRALRVLGPSADVWKSQGLRLPGTLDLQPPAEEIV